MEILIKNIGFKIYLFLFIFTMVNREFLFFQIDLRFIVFPLGLALLLYGFFKKEYKDNKVNKSMNWIYLFYIFVFLSNISWLWNGLSIHLEKFINEMILILNICTFFLIMRQYKKYITSSFVNKCIIFSCTILVASMILVSLGFTAQQISASVHEPVKYVSTEIDSGHRNLYGWNFRPSGYASDPNYATFLLLIGCISILKLKTKKIYKIIFTTLFLFAIGMSFSKTIFGASILGLFYLLLIKCFEKNKKIIKIINLCVILGIISTIVILPNISFLNKYMPYTIKTRFTMWNSASELFQKSPIIGNGITSFRSYFSENHWYVQSHNTYWQILSETGIIGILLFLIIFYQLLNERKNDKKSLYITFVFLIFMIDFEMIAMQFIVYPLYLCALEEKEKKQGKKALFMVNSLNNGGAERVCINMANELLSRDYQVDFILLNQNLEENLSYQIDPKIHIYDLKINDKNKLKKMIHLLFSVFKVNHIIAENEQEEAYCLITSHLPKSNFLTRISVVGKRAIYVFHSRFSYYKGKKNLLYRAELHYLYNRKKLVTVSEGVKQEAISDYGMNENYIKTIYNPILFDEIKNKMNESIPLQEPYILSVGRFMKEKRQDRMIDIFYQGKFYEKYKLVFCGTGELETKIKQKVKDYKIEDKVLFMGWQDNVYKWMKNANLLVCTSDTEGFPMNLIEAMVCKTKIVSSNCSFGPSEILIGEYANYLVEPDNIEEYIEKINQALTSYPTHKPQILEQCMASNVIDRYLEFYQL